MQYQEAVAYTHSLLRFGIRPGLGRMSSLMAQLGNPQERLKVVHIAGTNGKGSVSTMLSGMFTHAGHRTGLFTSPYVRDFRERIQINGEMVPQEMFARAVTQLRPIVERMAREGDQPTEFELITAAAYWIFEQAGCEVAVIETGLGGRLDSTNIVARPAVCVLTSISMDHMNVLGGTIAEIAREKCGIFKPCVPVVVSYGQREEAMDVIRVAAAEKQCPLVFAQPPQVTNLSLSGGDFVMDAVSYHVAMPGEQQVQNAVTAILAAQQAQAAGIPLEQKDMLYGLSHAVLPARTQVFSKMPPVILDGAHNADGVRKLADNLSRFLPGQTCVFVCGMMEDKAYQQALQLLAPSAARMIACTPSNPRALPAPKLAGCANQCGISCAVVPAPAEACRFGYSVAKRENRPLVVCGSLYLAGDVYQTLCELTGYGMQ